MNQSIRLTSNQIKQAELHILDAYVATCQELNISYSLCGGTLLGAIRHKGFIPWDDDIDVCMSRPEYEIFLLKGPPLLEKKGFKISFYPDVSATFAPFVKVIDPSIIVRTTKDCSDSYLWIDVFPVDGLPVQEHQIRKEYAEAFRIRMCIFAATESVSSAKNLFHRIIKYFISIIVKHRSVLRAMCNFLSNLAQSVPYGSTSFVGIVTWGMYGVGERMPLDGFNKKTLVTFEKRELSCMSCWHEYLHGIYGDYMKLPPVEQRKSHGITARKMGA